MFPASDSDLERIQKFPGSRRFPARSKVPPKTWLRFCGAIFFCLPLIQSVSDESTCGIFAHGTSALLEPLGKINQECAGLHVTEAASLKRPMVRVVPRRECPGISVRRRSPTGRKICVAAMIRRPIVAIAGRSPPSVPSRPKYQWDMLRRILRCRLHVGIYYTKLRMTLGTSGHEFATSGRVTERARGRILWLSAQLRRRQIVAFAGFN